MNTFDFLTKYYPKMGATECGKVLNLKPKKVLKLAHKYGIKLERGTLRKILKMGQFISPDDRPVNHLQFIYPNTPEVVYLLGIIWADGCIWNDTVKLYMKSSDAVSIKEIFDKTGRWNASERNNNGNMSGEKLTTFYTKNPLIYEHLVKNGYYHKTKEGKSVGTILHTIPEELKFYFWRGIFDGDGCVRVNEKRFNCYVSISGPNNQDWSEQIKLFNKLNIASKIYQRKNPFGCSSSIDLTKKSDVLKFLEFIYGGKTFGLPRKREKFLLIKNFKDRRFKQNRPSDTM